MRHLLRAHCVAFALNGADLAVYQLLEAHTLDTYERQRVRAGQAPQAVGVPTHFFKVVLSERTDPKTSERSTALAAFALPNRPIDPATPLTSFVVPLEFLESVTGVEFFPGAVAEGARRAVDAAAAGAHLETCLSIHSTLLCNCSGTLR